MAICGTCKSEFDNQGDSWKRQCYDCYKNFKSFDGKYGAHMRIRKVGYKSGVYITHPSVTAEDVNQWIDNNGYEKGWGAVEWKPENWSKIKIYVNSENYD